MATSPAVNHKIYKYSCFTVPALDSCKTEADLQLLFIQHTSRSCTAAKCYKVNMAAATPLPVLIFGAGDELGTLSLLEVSFYPAACSLQRRNTFMRCGHQTERKQQQLQYGCSVAIYVVQECP